MSDALLPLPVQWDGEVFKPITGYWARQADRHLVVGQTYTMEVREPRSPASHGHYFASVTDAHENLPEAMADRWATPDHLRRYALIRTGWRDERSIACTSKADALRVAAFIRPMDEYAVVVAHEAVVVVMTAKSQSLKAMGRKDFQASKQAVLDYLATLIGTTSDALARAGEAA